MTTTIEVDVKRANKPKYYSIALGPWWVKSWEMSGEQLVPNKQGVPTFASEISATCHPGDAWVGYMTEDLAQSIVDLFNAEMDIDAEGMDDALTRISQSWTLIDTFLMDRKTTDEGGNNLAATLVRMNGGATRTFYTCTHRPMAELVEVFPVSDGSRTHPSVQAPPGRWTIASQFDPSLYLSDPSRVVSGDRHGWSWDVEYAIVFPSASSAEACLAGLDIPGNDGQIVELGE